MIPGTTRITVVLFCTRDYQPTKKKCRDFFLVLDNNQDIFRESWCFVTTLISLFFKSFMKNKKIPQKSMSQLKTKTAMLYASRFFCVCSSLCSNVTFQNFHNVSRMPFFFRPECLSFCLRSLRNDLYVAYTGYQVSLVTWVPLGIMPPRRQNNAPINKREAKTRINRHPGCFPTSNTVVYIMPLSWRRTSLRAFDLVRGRLPHLSIAASKHLLERQVSHTLFGFAEVLWAWA